MSVLLDVLVVLVFGSTVILMGLWQFLSKGAWRHYPTGKALMGLLAAHALIFGMFAAAVFIPGFHAGTVAWVILCILLLAAKAHIGWVLWSTYKEHST